MFFIRRFAKRIISFLLILVLTLSLPVMAYASGVPSVTNTINYGGAYVFMDYYDMSGKLCYITAKIDSDGWFNLKKPTNYASFRCAGVSLERSSLPPSGAYEFKLRVGTQAVLTNSYSRADVMYLNSYDNSADTYSATDVLMTQNMGDVSVSGSIQVTGQMLYFRFFSSDRVTGCWSGQVKVSFTRMKAGSTPSISDSYSSAQDTQNEISNSVKNIDAAMGDVNDSLQEIVQTISYQLQAFWNQLAGEFTNLYNKMNQQHTELINAIKNGLEVTIIQEFDELIRNDNWNHNDQLANDDRNTQTIVNGYDNSGMNQDNDRLNNSLNEYADAENTVLDSVNGSLGNFDFSSSLDGYVTSVSLVGGFIQRVYDSSGALKDAINISFFLSIAGIVIGLYRFKEG